MLLKAVFKEYEIAQAKEITISLSMSNFFFHISKRFYKQGSLKGDVDLFSNTYI